jgi:tetratricopeptide (TPR) repeat protein
MIESYVHDENLKEIPASLINNPQFRKGMEVPVMQFLSKNDTFNAYRILDQLEAAYPNYAEVWYLEGLVSINKGETDKAQEMFWHALTLDPKFSKAYFALGNISLESHDYTKATSFYTQAEVAGGPERIIASNQAVAAVMTGNLSVAKQHLERAFHAGMKECEAFTAKDEFKAIKSRPEFKTLFSVCQEMEKVQ